MKNHYGFIGSEDKTLYMLGKNSYGQLGTGDTSDCFTKVQVMSDVQDFGIGFYHTTVLTIAGDVLCSGQGFGSRFVPITGLHGIKKIGVSFFRSYALDQDGTLYEWSNKDDVHIVDVDRRVVDIAIGGKFYYLRDENGGLGMCGNNAHGQLLVRVPFLKNVVWIDDERADMIAAGSHHFVYTVGGVVRSLGSNTHGQLPRDIYGRVYEISCGEYSTTVKTEWYHYMFGQYRYPYNIAPEREKLPAVVTSDGIALADQSVMFDIYAGRQEKIDDENGSV